MNHLDADIYALQEVVNTDSFISLVNSLEGNYSYLISPYGSLAPEPTSSQYASAQKLAFIYRSSMVKNVSARALLKGSPYAYSNWASGRYPFLVSADVLGKDSAWRNFKFVIIHAKAKSDPGSCNRRLSGSEELKDSLDLHFAGNRLIILGDFNDDLDETICGNFPESAYSSFVKDSMDADSYHAVTLPLSQSGVSSIAGYSSFLDHVIISNEVLSYYVPESAEMLKDKVTDWVSSYTYYVSDHYPVLTKYVLHQTTGTVPEMSRENLKVYPIPSSGFIIIENPESRFSGYELFSAEGKKLLSGPLTQGLNRLLLAGLPAGFYFVRLQGTKEVQTQQIILKP